MSFHIFQPESEDAGHILDLARRTPELNRGRVAGTHQVGWFDRSKPTLGKKAASATPPAFRDALLSIAGTCPSFARAT